VPFWLAAQIASRMKNSSDIRAYFGSMGGFCWVGDTVAPAVVVDSSVVALVPWSARVGRTFLHRASTVSLTIFIETLGHLQMVLKRRQGLTRPIF
jgi:hypothetical protein